MDGGLFGEGKYMNCEKERLKSFFLLYQMWMSQGFGESQLLKVHPTVDRDIFWATGPLAPLILLTTVEEGKEGRKTMNE